MKTLVITLAGTVLAMLGAPEATAHHSAAAMDFGNTVQIEGVVREVEVVNPHLKLVLRVTGERGTRDIEYEGHSRNNVYRSGWRSDMLRVGDRITVTIAPMRDGTDGGYVTSFVTATGEQVGFQ